MSTTDPGTWGVPLLERVGAKTAEGLAALDLHTVGDLLWHLPRRYYKQSELTSLEQLQVGENVTVLGQVKSASTRRMQRRRGDITTVVVTDGVRDVSLTFFKQRWREKQLYPGRRALFSGRVAVYKGRLQLTHPQCEMLDEDGPEPGLAMGAGATEAVERLIAVYPATEKLPSWQVSKAVEVVLPDVEQAPDPIPAHILTRLGLLSRSQAMRAIHRPQDEAEIAAARRRLRFEEALLLQTELLRRRALVSEFAAVPRPTAGTGLLTAFDRQLALRLTAGQVRVGEQIADDLAQPTPMHRLLQGEVGSGKTLVALRAMLTVVDSGGQAVLLAPTEVLASQHARALRSMLGPLGEAGMLGGSAEGTRVSLLTGSMRAKQRHARLLEIASGQAGIIVGTHALLYEKVQYASLGLVVVDEQHRFGVEQRSALASEQPDGTRPHVLVMTATPIPRTVAMTVFGDLDVSTLTELPAGRAEVTSHVVPASEKPHYLDRVWERVREEVAEGRRAFVVCPRIGEEAAAGSGSTGSAGRQEPESEDLGEPPIEADGTSDQSRSDHAPTSVLDLYASLVAGPLAGLRVGMLHGRMDGQAKDDAMRSFAAGDLDVLVSTTVIEVGVDVPEAGVIVVMDAERFGVSQLHQLRGRVGRGGHPGICLLVTQATSDSPAAARLAAVAATTDGFELARLDLAQRREGDVLGAAQSGRRSSLRVLSVLRDQETIEQARQEAMALLESDPDLRSHPELQAELADLQDSQQAEYLEKT